MKISRYLQVMEVYQLESSCPGQLISVALLMFILYVQKRGPNLQQKSIVKGIPLKVGAQKKNDFEQAQAFVGNLRAEHLLEHFNNII